jgi:hypothetical protein
MNMLKAIMKQQVLTILWILSFLCANGQIVNVPGVGNEVLRIKKYADVEGSPYLYSDWKSGVVQDRNGKIYANVLIKYDSYKDVVEINQEGGILLLNQDLYPAFSFSFTEPGTDKIIKHMFQSGFSQIPGYHSKNYFEVLHREKLTVLKKYEVKFVEEVVNSYGTAAGTKRFQKSEKYFMLKDDTATEFKLNEKSVLSAIGERQGELKKYIASEKLRVKNDGDLIKLMNYFQQLQ